ncbi:MAG TPA: D-alanyl-D-alanine carboxypeptidase family protein [Acetobacteraceae bacterium]|nr:D-alanyl-D-alanine carboxypeptidase family protein [Acetobacteraceae bacterium]
MINFRSRGFSSWLALAAMMPALAAPLGAAAHGTKAAAHDVTKAGSMKNGPEAAAPAQPAGPPPDAPLADAATPPPPDFADISSYMLIDAATGAVIAEKAPHAEVPPASLTKLMTAYLVYQAIAHGSLKLDQDVPVSDAAWHTGGSRMFIQPLMTVTVDQLLHGLIIDSGNDAAVALAEQVGGTQDAFVAMMNSEAKKLDLAETNYTDVDGLPDPALHTSAADVATLSLAFLKKYPQVLAISSEQSYTFNNITQRSWNPVLFHDSTVDGLKTGLTKESGHCIDATAKRDGRRLIAVVMGGSSWRSSTAAIEALLDYGYKFYGNSEIAKQGAPIGMITSEALDPEQVPVGAQNDLTVTLPSDEVGKLQTNVTYNAPFVDAIQKGEVVGSVSVSSGGKIIATVPAVALADAKQAGFFTRLGRHIKKIL